MAKKFVQTFRCLPGSTVSCQKCRSTQNVCDDDDDDDDDDGDDDDDDGDGSVGVQCKVGRATMNNHLVVVHVTCTDVASDAIKVA